MGFIPAAIYGFTLCLGLSPIDLVWLPAVLSPETKSERLEAHRFISNIAREDKQIGPGDFVTVLLLNGPELSQSNTLLTARAIYMMQIFGGAVARLRVASNRRQLL